MPNTNSQSFRLIDTENRADALGINFTPQGDGTVEVVSWEVWDGGPESGPGSRHATQVMSLEEARSLYREARSAGMFPPTK